jgi:hypothetical protein
VDGPDLGRPAMCAADEDVRQAGGPGCGCRTVR